MLKEIIDKIQKSKSLIFANFDRLTVAENQALRQELKGKSAEFLVAKKTITNLALRQAGLEGLDARQMPGKLALVFAYEDEVEPAKVVAKFKKQVEGELDILAGFLAGQVLSAEAAQNLAQIPSKPELQAQMVGSLSAPLRGLVNVLAGPMRGLVYALQAIKEKKEN